MTKKRQGNKVDSKPQNKKKMEDQIAIEEMFAKFPNFKSANPNNILINSLKKRFK